MDLKKHKKWVNDYMNKNYSCVPVLASKIEVDNNCNFVLESWDSRLNIWKDQIPFMKKDKFCKIAEIGYDRDGRYCHYKFVFPFDYVENEINSKSSSGSTCNQSCGMKNEDKYTNFAERASAFGEYCAKNNRLCNTPGNCVGKSIKCTNCLLGWLEDDAI